MTALPAFFSMPCLRCVLVPLSASADTVRIYVTNSAGDNIHVIDPATNKVVQVFKGPEAMHGVAFSPDGARVYISNESQSTLDVFDRKSGKLHQAGDAEQPAEQHRGRQGRPHRRRHRPRRRRARHHRPGDPDAEEVHPGPRPPAQRLCHARQQIRHHRLDPGEPADRHRSRNRAGRLGAQAERRRPPDDHRDQSGRLDQAHLRAALRPQRLCGGRFRQPQGNRPRRVAEARDATSKPTAAGIPRRRTASASRRTTRRCG